MKIIEKLLWIYDPRTDEKKAYEKWDKTTPLQKRTQKLLVHVKDAHAPLVYNYVKEDWKFGKENHRWASSEKNFNVGLKIWLKKRATEGIMIGDIWYGPESVLRIELGEQTLEDLK